MITAKDLFQCGYLACFFCDPGGHSGVHFGHLELLFLKVKQVDKTKYLGVTVDDTLGWEEQYESVKKKGCWGPCSNEET